MNPFEGFSDNISDLEPRDYLLRLNLDFDVDSQLIAICWLLNRNQKADKEQTEEIRQIEEHTRHVTGLAAEHAVDQWVDQLHYSTYQSAAHSMSAVGMLAPLLETIFYQCFRGIGREFYPATSPARSHARWESAHAVQWDCHFVITGKHPTKNVVQGILQLADAIGLLDRLPADLARTLSALFSYRNNMFHHGFEWPVEERQKFAKRITDEGWPADWFSKAEVGNEPLIFYMTDKFIDHCMNTINQILDATGLFVKDVLVPLQDARGD